MKKVPPLLVTGLFRSGKSTLTSSLLATKKFRRIHEPFSNYRGLKQNSSIISNLKHTITCITTQNAKKYQDDICALINYFTYSYRVAIDGGITAKKFVRYCGKIFLRFGYQWRLPLIDDPFLILSVPWLREVQRWNIIIMTRNPLDFVAVRKRNLHGFDLRNFTEQEELMKGPLNLYANELRHLVENAGSMSIVMQNAYLWKYVHVCILDFIARFPEVVLIKFEDMKADGFNQISRWIKEKYNVDLSMKNNPFSSFSYLESDILTDQEKVDIINITESQARLLYDRFLENV